MLRIQWMLLAVAIGAGPLLAGSAAADSGHVVGTVHVGGQPLADGKIVLHREGGQFIGTNVKAGKYSLEGVPVPPGTYKVTIEGKGVPARYSRSDVTSLTANISDKENIIDFNLISNRNAPAGSHTVSGTVYWDGAPLPGGKIAFHLDNGEFVGGKVNAGRFTIGRLPVPTGAYSVTIEGKDIPAKYTTPDQTPLRVKILGEGRDAFNFSLTNP